MNRNNEMLSVFKCKSNMTNANKANKKMVWDKTLLGNTG